MPINLGAPFLLCCFSIHAILYIMNRTNIIYALVDPITNEIRYIGKSTIGLVRPKRHAEPHSLKKCNHKNNWIKTLIKQNLMYKIQILEDNINLSELNSKEQYWISYYKKENKNLTNLTEGGEGTIGYRLSEETKQRISEKQKEWHKCHKPSHLMLTNSYKKRECKNMNGIIQTTCSDCNKFKSISEFSKHSTRQDGIQSICKDCAKLRKKEYDKNTRILLSPEQLAESYKKRTPKMQESLKRYYANNPQRNKYNNKPILQLNIQTGEIIKEFESAISAKSDGFNNTNIGQAIRHNKPYKGYYWKYKQ